MKLRIDIPPPQLDWQIPVPLSVETPAGATVQIANWSLAGLLWPATAGTPPRTGIVSVPFQGADIRFPVRLSAPDAIGLVTLQGLSPNQRETLARSYHALLSGQVACAPAWTGPPSGTAPEDRTIPAPGARPAEQRDPFHLSTSPRKPESQGSLLVPEGEADQPPTAPQGGGFTPTRGRVPAYVTLLKRCRFSGRCSSTPETPTAKRPLGRHLRNWLHQTGLWHGYEVRGH